MLKIKEELANDLMNLYEGIDEEYLEDLHEALQDKEKWNDFCEKHNVKPIEPVRVDDEVECVSIIKFNSKEEQDDFFIKEGKITEEER